MKLFRKIIFFMFVITAIISFSVVVEAEESLPVNNFIYKVNSTNDGTAMITGYCGTDTDITVPSEIDGYIIKEIGVSAFSETALRRVIISDGIEIVSNGAFSGSEIEYIYFPDSVRTIAKYVFQDCYNLKTVEGMKNVKSIQERAFLNCTSLKSFTFPDNVVTINEKVLAGCTGITEINLHDNIREIKDDAFYKCSISEFYIPASAETITAEALNDVSDTKIVLSSDNEKFSYENGVLLSDNNSKVVFCFEITNNQYIVPDTVEIIGEKAFMDRADLLNIEFNEGLEVIEDRAFYNCVNIEKIELPSTIETIGILSFGNCGKQEELVLPENLVFVQASAFSYTSFRKLFIGGYQANYGGGFFDKSYTEELVLGEGIKTVGMMALEDSTSLKKVQLPSTLKTISNAAFYGCTALENIVLPENLEVIGDSAFAQCTALKEITIPKHVKTISKGAFRDCVALENICFEGNITEIPEGIFKNCSSLSEITLPQEVQIIGEGSFENCVALKDIDFVTGVTSIGDYGFKNCKAITEFNGFDTVIEIGESAFEGCENLRAIDIADPNKVDIGAFAFKGTKWYNSQPDGLIHLGKSVLTYKGEMADGTILVIPEGVEKIRKSAFVNQRNLSGVVLPESLITIENDAFNGCVGISEMTIPKNTTEIKTRAFYNCSALEKINTDKKSVIKLGLEVFDNTKWYNSQDSVVYLGKILYKYKPKNDELEYKIKSDTIAIAGGAFYKTSELYIDMVIPASVRYIGLSAFYCPEALIWLDFKPIVCEIEPSSIYSKYYAYLYCYVGSSAWDYLDSHSNVYGAAYAQPAHKYGITNLFVDSTCISEGIKIRECVCGLVKQETIPAKGHSFSEYFSDKNATCTMDGTKTAKCDNCDLTDTMTDIGSAGHIYEDHVAQAATCTEKGWNDFQTCSRCDFTSYIEIPASGHSLGLWTQTKAPTCTKLGEEIRKCSKCEYYETKEITKLGHKPMLVDAVEATTTRDGNITYYDCLRCDSNFSDSAGKNVITGVKITYIKNILLSETEYIYNGKIRTPSVTVKDGKGKTLKKDTDYTVKYASGRKSTGKYTVTVTFKGKYSGTKKLTFNILPKATSKVTATQTTTSVKAKWSKVTGASGYKVQLISSKNKTLKTVYTTKLEYNFTKLSKGTTYKVKVTAYKTIDSKKVYSTSSKTLTTATKPATVTLSKVTAGSKQVAVNWKTVTGATGYEIVYSTSKDFKKSKKTATIKKQSTKKTTIKKLTKGKTYYFKVRAYKTVDGKKLYSAYSSVKSVKVK